MGSASAGGGFTRVEYHSRIASARRGLGRGVGSRGMQPERERVSSALTIAVGLTIAGALGLSALAQFVDPAAALGRAPDLSHEPPGLPPLPERVSTFPESPAHLRAMLAARVRLRPDRRVLAAVSDLSRLHTGTASEATARFDSDRWTVLHGNTVVGPLPASPTFRDALAMLSAWDASLRRRRSAEVRPAPVPPEALGWGSLDARRTPAVALDRVEAVWARGHRSPELAAAAARGSVALAVTTPDDADDGALVAGRALAALAWAAGAGADVRDAAALLAHAMGYRGDARALSVELNPRSAVRAYVSDDDATLRASAARDDDPAGPALWRRRLVERGDLAAARALPSPVGVAAMLPADAAEATLAQALAALEREASLDAAPDAVAVDAVLPRAELLAARRAPRGPFVDRALLLARDRAVIASALARAIDLATQRDGPRAARELVARFGARAPETYRDLVAWATALTRVADRAQPPETLLLDLAPTTHHAGALLARSAALVALRVARDNPRRRQAFESLVTHLDSRPSHRRALLAAALDDTRDRVLADALCATLRADGAPAPRCDAALTVAARPLDAPLWPSLPVTADDEEPRAYAWLLRAATALRAPPDEPRRTAVVTYYVTHATHPYDALGRYLMGRAALHDALALSEREPLRAAVAFFVGERALAEGRVAEAADWYQLARLAGSPRDREFAWAADRLDAIAHAPLAQR
jgi:hypothetical protein